jgi:hypothetical protein
MTVTISAADRTSSMNGWGNFTGESSDHTPRSRESVTPVGRAPDAFLDDERYGVLATRLKAHRAAAGSFAPRTGSAPHRACAA